MRWYELKDVKFHRALVNVKIDTKRGSRDAASAGKSLSVMECKVITEIPY